MIEFFEPALGVKIPLTQGEAKLRMLIGEAEIARQLNVTHKTIWSRVHPNGAYYAGE